MRFRKIPGTGLLFPTLVGSSLLTPACAADLETDGDAIEAGPTTTDEGEFYATVIDASDGERWRHFDFEAAEEVDEGDVGWDLAFSRFHIKLNGGSSGEAGVAVAALFGEDFDGLEMAPSEGYFEDAQDGDDEGDDPDYAFAVGEGWYAYDPSDHTLSPNTVVYVVHSSDQKFYKLAMTGYYNAAGSSGFPAFRWSEIEVPSAEIVVMPATGLDSAGRDGLDQEEAMPPDDEGRGDEPDPAANGCYDMRDHACDCESDEATCIEVSGVWTDACGCGEDG